MKKYYVRKTPQTNGDHEVHTEDCYWLPLKENRIYLGEFNNCKDAVKKAKKDYPQSNGCIHCSILCHTS